MIGNKKKIYIVFIFIMEVANEMMKKMLIYRAFGPHPVANLVKSNVKRYKQSLPWDSFLDDEEEPCVIFL